MAESHTRLKQKAKNLMMDAMTKDLWHQCTNKDDPAALWEELRKDYHKAGVPELGKELAKYVEMTRNTFPDPQKLLNALKTQHSKIEITMKGTVFHPKYLSWRYIHEMSKFKPLFDIPLARYEDLNEYPPADEVKRALEAHLVNHSDIPKKPTVENTTTPAASASANTTQAESKKRKHKEKRNKPANQSTEAEIPLCKNCGRRHNGECWFKDFNKIPKAAREKLLKKRK
jgi:hypothetical protein